MFRITNERLEIISHSDESQMYSGDLVAELAERIIEVEKKLHDANEDANRLAAELEIEQNPGYSCQELRLHYQRIKK